MRAAIFGGSGFLGRSLTKRCVSSGWDVTVYDLPGTDPKITGAKFHAIDLCAEVPVMDGPTPIVYYLAQSPHYRDPYHHIDDLFVVNTLGAIRAAKASLASGCRVFCYASTGNVYQKSLCPFSEDMPVRRDDPYVLSKLTAEEALSLFNPPFMALSMRLFGLFGPGQNSMLPSLIKGKILQREPIVLYPSDDERERIDTGGLKVSFCYVEDAALALLKLAEKRVDSYSGKETGVINIAGPEAISIKKMAEIMGNFLGIEPVFKKSPMPRDFDLIGDIYRLRNQISIEFTPFEKAIESTVLSHQG